VGWGGKVRISVRKVYFGGSSWSGWWGMCDLFLVFAVRLVCVLVLVVRVGCY